MLMWKRAKARPLNFIIHEIENGQDLAREVRMSSRRKHRSGRGAADAVTPGGTLVMARSYSSSEFSTGGDVTPLPLAELSAASASTSSYYNPHATAAVMAPSLPPAAIVELPLPSSNLRRSRGSGACASVRMLLCRVDQLCLPSLLCQRLLAVSNRDAANTPGPHGVSPPTPSPSIFVHPY